MLPLLIWKTKSAIIYWNKCYGDIVLYNYSEAIEGEYWSKQRNLTIMFVDQMEKMVSKLTSQE